MANFSLTFTSTNLGTSSFKLPNDGTFAIDGKIQIPKPMDGSVASQLVVVINKNGSAQYTGLAGSAGFYKEVSGVAGDLIAIVLSSAAAVDNAMNAIKCTVAVSEKV